MVTLTNPDVHWENFWKNPVPETQDQQKKSQMTNPKKQIITKFNPDSYRDQNSKRIPFKSLKFLNWNLFAFANRSLLWQTQVCFWYLFLGISSCLLPHAYCRQNNIDSLSARLKQNLHDTDRINILNVFAWELRNSNPDSAILCCKKVLSLSEKLLVNADKRDALWRNAKTGIAISYNNLGECNRLKGNYRQSIEYYTKSLVIWKEFEKEISPGIFKKRISTALGNIGAVYWNLGEFPKALDYFFRALKISEELGDVREISRHNSNIGVIYWNQRSFPLALDYLFKALNAAEELGNKQMQANTLGNIGGVYFDRHDYAKALQYFNSDLKIAEELNDKNGIEITLGNIGSVYAMTGDINKALDYMSGALKISGELGDKTGIAFCLGGIGTLLTKSGKFDKAETYLYRAIAFSDSIESLSLIEENNRYISELYDTTGRYELAYKHFKKHYAAKDSLFNKERSKEIGRMEAKYDYEKKQAIAEAEHKKETELAAAIEKRQRVVLVLTLAAAAAIAVIALIILRSLRITKKQKMIIEGQKRLVEQKQEEILASIRYARRIQNAMLPTQKYLERIFLEAKQN